MRRRQYFLSIIFVCLTIIIILPWWKGDASKVTPTNDKKATVTQLVFQLPEYEENGFEAIIQRPLFNPKRRPSEKTPTLPAREINRSALLKLKIKGIVASGRKKMILVEKNNKTLELYLGAKLGGWVLKDVAADSVIFSDGKIEIDLLKINRNAKKQATSRDTRWLPKARQSK